MLKQLDKVHEVLEEFMFMSLRKSQVILSNSVIHMTYL